ncbi:uncharacterized protein [Dermacentor andersoni]|uniref:uncharacterized protein n=1 Tax=Dermacentor andersoni TaxID=34620 RepID=UPI003B3AEC15
MRLCCKYFVPVNSMSTDGGASIAIARERSGNLCKADDSSATRPAMMSTRRKQKNGVSASMTAEDTRKTRNTRERLRHRTVMRRLDELVSRVPLDTEIFKTRASQLKRTIEYFHYLEDTIQAICKERDIPLPRDYQMFLANRSCLSGEGSEHPTTRAQKAFASKELPRTQMKPSHGEALVPDLEFPPDIDVNFEQETDKWEHYGISKEDWMAAGSSQQSTPVSLDQAVPAVPNKTFVDIIYNSATSTPLKEAPEYFVISATGDVTSVGKLP